MSVLSSEDSRRGFSDEIFAHKKCNGSYIYNISFALIPVAGLYLLMHAFLASSGQLLQQLQRFSLLFYLYLVVHSFLTLLEVKMRLFFGFLRILWHHKLFKMRLYCPHVDKKSKLYHMQSKLLKANMKQW